MDPAQIRRLVLARCPEVTEDDLDTAFLPVEVGKQIEAVLTAIEARLNAMAQGLDAEEAENAFIDSAAETQH